MRIRNLGNIGVLIVISIISLSVKAQIPEIVSETWYLRSLQINDVTYYPPYDAEIRMDFDGDTATFISTGILNTLEGDVMFNDTLDQLTLSDISNTELECDVDNCDFEALLFYEFLTNASLEANTFEFQYLDLVSFVNKRLRLTDSNGSLADFVFDPIVPISEDAFQTWYLFSTSVDLGETTFYEGEDVPQLTINDDFSFFGEENCWSYEGQFEYVSIGLDDLPHFYITEFNQECNQEGSEGTVLLNFLGYVDFLGLYVGENDLYLEEAPGFVNHFKNTTTLGVDEFLSNKVSLSPNPTNTITRIYYEERIDQWDMYDITGKHMVSKNYDERSVDLTSFQSGIYILKIKSEERTIVKKIIKN